MTERTLKVATYSRVSTNKREQKHGKLSAAEVQDSIHFFAFDLRRNGKGRELKGTPLNFFMGILRKGLPYAPPENYESPEAEARRKYLEGKRRLEVQQIAQERELRELDFAEWRRGLAPNQVDAIVPEAVRSIAPAREVSLKTYFETEVWPLRRMRVSGADAEREAIKLQIDRSLAESQTNGGISHDSA